MNEAIKKLNRSRIMASIRSKDTKPEITVRKWLHLNGYRFRLHCSSLPGRPDIVLAKYRTVIFVNGCFWHGHTCSKGKSIPKSNQTFWIRKIEANKRRDRLVRRKLRKLDWNIITIWECQTKNPLKLAQIISNALQKSEGTKQ